MTIRFQKGGGGGRGLIYEHTYVPGTVEYAFGEEMGSILHQYSGVSEYSEFAVD